MTKQNKDYNLILTTPEGVRLRDLNDVVGLSASREVDGLGWGRFVVKAAFDTDLFRRDLLIQLWRRPLGLWECYMLRKPEFAINADGETIITLEGPSDKDLLRRRITASYSGSSQTQKTGAADDVMKEFVTEAFTDGANPAPDAGTRVLSNFTVQADISAGPSIDIDWAWKKLLTESGGGVLAKLRKMSAQLGTEVFYDVVVSNVAARPLEFQFVTSTGQPGFDRSASLTFSIAKGNLRTPKLSYDYTEEENYIYSGGQDQGSARDIQQVYDSARYNASPYNRCEGFADARNQESSAAVQDAGNARLFAGRGRVRFTGQPIDTRGTRFGRDWDWGDKVGVSAFGFGFTAIFRTVVLTLDEGGNERVGARLDYEGVV